MKKIRELKGANMDIDLVSKPGYIHWKQDKCPWNIKDNSNKHKCALKNVSICKYFKGIKILDIVLCAYPQKGAK
ncbi:MAG: hypothetical protein V1815_01755 [Candidatus Woesearchaeota archaeon]